MKRIAMAVLLLALAVPALGQTVKDGQTYNTAAGTPAAYGDGGTYKVATTTSGLPVTQGGGVLAGTNAIIAGTYAVGAVDSIAVPIDVHLYPNLSLVFDYQNVASARLAVQVRLHINGSTDTSLTIPWMPATTTGNVAIGDSAYSVVNAPSATAPAGDEFIVKLNHSLWAGGSVVTPAMTGKRVVQIGTVVGPAAFQYVTVRIRVLGAGNTGTYKVRLVGTSAR